VLCETRVTQCATDGSINEKTALLRLSEFLSIYGVNPDLPVFIDEPGIWLSAEHPFLAGSPDNAVA